MDELIFYVPPSFSRLSEGCCGITGRLALQQMRSLSGGQKSRVVLAELMIHRPHLLLLDEVGISLVQTELFYSHKCLCWCCGGFWCFLVLYVWCRGGVLLLLLLSLSLSLLLILRDNTGLTTLLLMVPCLLFSLLSLRIEATLVKR